MNSFVALNIGLYTEGWRCVLVLTFCEFAGYALLSTKGKVTPTLNMATSR